MNKLFLILSITIFAQAFGEKRELNDSISTSIHFETSDSLLNELYTQAEEKAKWNLSTFGKYDVLVEGAQYQNVWLETQPMGGYMYAKRNLNIAHNNITIFLDHQRADGRLPGMIAVKNDTLDPKYGWFQGFCLPMPAFELYYLLGRDKNYLEKVYRALEQFDKYLWKTRDSDNNGCLESWCIWDTGEDNSVRFNGYPHAWPFDYPPSKEKITGMSEKELNDLCQTSPDETRASLSVPIESMDIMSYSYTCRDVLSLISNELNNGKENEWRGKADQVRDKIKNYLWDDNQKACFDKDLNNATMPVLLHNNLRCMYFGSFDQKMADEFVEHHLLNPEEFWTPMPLPSIAANDPYFRNIPGNNWSGQPQGLTFQRSIRALENYGHFAELTMIGETFLKVLSDSMKFTQQFYPFQKTINNSKDGYGPSILSTLEFISRFYGTHITQDKIYWSSINNKHDYAYRQHWNNIDLEIKTKKDELVSCYLNGEKIASFSSGVRLVTDTDGQLIEIVGITNQAKEIKVAYKGKSYYLEVKPNSVYRLNENGEFYLFKSVPFSMTELNTQAQEKPFPGADSSSPSIAYYFTWINNTRGGGPEQQTFTNLEFFRWLKEEYGMQIDIYAYDADILDGGGGYVDLDSEKFRKNYPNSFGPVSRKAAEMGIRLGVWLGPDGYGDTAEEEKGRTEMLVSLCRDYNFRVFKMDLMNTQLRPEKQDAFISAMKECRKYAPDLLVLNHRVDFGKAAPYVTTNLWNGDETYIDVHMTNDQTATHNRVAAISRGLTPGLERLLEDHGVCLSSCLDYWEDDLIMQAFNRCLLLAPELYGNPWFLRDNEYPRLARIFNIHRNYRDILINGMILDEERYGESAVSRGDNNTRFITLSNISWETKSYELILDESLGLGNAEHISLIQYHPFEEYKGEFNYGDKAKIEVYPFRTVLLMATNSLPDEALIKGCAYELVQNVPAKDVRIKLLGYPGSTSKISLVNKNHDFAGAQIDQKDVPALLSGEEISISFKGEALNNDWHRKIGDLKPTSVPPDAEALYEATCFAADNNALEVRSLQRSGPTSIPEVKASRDAFFEQDVFIDKGVWDKFLFDGDSTTKFNILHRQRDFDGGALRLDLGKNTNIDSLIISLDSIQSARSFFDNNDLLAEVSNDLKKWTTVEIGLSGCDLILKSDSKSSTFRYLRLSKAPSAIKEITGFYNDLPLERSAWRASNLFTPYSQNKAVKAWTHSFRLDSEAEGSYLVVAINGSHGKEGAYAALRSGKELIGAGSRSPSFLANVWEYRVQTRDGNYTYFFPVTKEMQGKDIDVVVMGLNNQIENLQPELWITAYPIPFQEKELILKRKD